LRHLGEHGPEEFDVATGKPKANFVVVAGADFKE